jgi:hypothetical protein
MIRHGDPMVSKVHMIIITRIGLLARLDTLQTPNRASRVSSAKKLNGDEIAETLQSEASFTIATDKKNLLLLLMVVVLVLL